MPPRKARDDRNMITSVPNMFIGFIMLYFSFADMGKNSICFCLLPTALRHIRLENNENKPVTNSRDTQVC